MTEKIRVSILIKKNETFDKKRESELRHNLKKTRIKTIISNTSKIRETTIYKRLSR